MSSESQKQDIVITRVFDAPVEQVWNAWKIPEIIMQWWGPDHFTAPSAEVDFRVGGTSLVCMRAPKDFGGQDMYNTWLYTKIVPMHQIDFITNLTDKDRNQVDPVALGLRADFPKDQLTTLIFKALADNKTELTVIEYDWAVGQMMEMSKMGMEQCLNKMALALKTA